MQFSGKGALNNLLKTFELNSNSENIILRTANNSFLLCSYNYYINYISNDILENHTEYHAIMWNSCNLFLDIDIKTSDVFDKVYDWIIKFKKRINNMFPKNKFKHIMFYPENKLGIHYHCYGLQVKNAKYLKDLILKVNLNTDFIDFAVYKTNASLRLPFTTKDLNKDKIYNKVEMFGNKYTIEEQFKYSNPSIVENEVVYRFIEDTKLLSYKELTVSNIKEILSYYGINSFKIGKQFGCTAYIIPQKPWSCPLCKRSHESNNLIIKGDKLICFQN